MAHQKLGLIRWTTLVGTGVVGAALGALALKVATALGQRVTAPGWAVPAGLALGGVAALAGAWFAHQRFHVLHRYPQPQRGLALTALAKACALGGAALAGAYLVLAAVNLPRWSVAAPHERVVRGLATAVAALLLMVGGKVLERECQTRHGGDDEPS